MSLTVLTFVLAAPPCLSPQEMLMLEIHYTSVYIVVFEKLQNIQYLRFLTFQRPISPQLGATWPVKIPDLGWMFIY